MIRQTIFAWLLSLTLVGSAAAQTPAAPPAKKEGVKKTEPVKTAVPAKGNTTLDNLQTAYDGESKARAMYDAFAAKAEAEGYKAVASLFRAAAEAERVHGDSHAKAIEGLGVKPQADVKPPQVKSTKENLEAALAGENQERLTLYPSYIKQAEKDKNRKAVRTFKNALAAETVHAQYFKEALANLETWKTGPKAFLVCSNCGYTTSDSKIRKCPICNFPREKIKEIK